MIITEHFVFIHMHKTGGQTLNDIIQRCISGHRRVGYHFPYSKVPPEFAALPRVGMVRNPWDWYISWYAFNQRPNIRNPLFAITSDRGQADFKSTVTNLINLGSDDPVSKRHRDELANLLPDSLDNNRGVGLTKDCIQSFSDNDTGYYSWLFSRMLGDHLDGQLLLGRFENFEDDFLAIMRQLKVGESSALEQELKKRERKNPSRHSHYSHYYDDELRDLVERKEGRLIERYDYRFEFVGSTENVAGSAANVSIGTSQGFQKLLGRASNYLLLHDSFDVGSIIEKIERIPQARWLESERERRFDVHRDTQALLCIHFEDYKYTEPEVRELYHELQEELKPLVKYIADFYQDNGFVVRLIFAKLLAGGNIPRHADGGFSLLNSHRVHIPIVTNDRSIFFVNGEEKSMQVGELWEINNKLIHMVENRGDEDRIHLIIDWMPNHAGQPQANVLAPDPVNGEDGQLSHGETLDMMVAEAYQAHRSKNVRIPELRRAESLYRQVLDIDSSHVAANNLLGLLCLQTKRFDEAAHYIEAALAKKPDDPQAHSNLGLALKDLGRYEEAVIHFQQALLFSPGNPKTLNNLGNVYRELGRLGEAIASYQKAVAIQPAYAEANHNLTIVTRQAEINR
jgi:tetratricopeptide (TPR) repeat protein